MDNAVNITAAPFYEGWQQKRGEKNVAWKSRYFVLKDDMLSYFTNPRAEKPQGQISLVGAKVVITYEKNQEKNQDKHGFSITTGDSSRVYMIRAAFEDEQKEWIGVLERAIQWCAMVATYGHSGMTSGNVNMQQQQQANAHQTMSQSHVDVPYSAYFNAHTRSKYIKPYLSTSEELLTLQSSCIADSFSQWRRNNGYFSKDTSFHSLVGVKYYNNNSGNAMMSPSSVNNNNNFPVSCTAYHTKSQLLASVGGNMIKYTHIQETTENATPMRNSSWLIDDSDSDDHSDSENSESGDETHERGKKKYYSSIWSYRSQSYNLVETKASTQSKVGTWVDATKPGHLDVLEGRQYTSATPVSSTETIRHINQTVRSAAFSTEHLLLGTDQGSVIVVDPGVPDQKAVEFAFDVTEPASVRMVVTNPSLPSNFAACYSNNIAQYDMDAEVLLNTYGIGSSATVSCLAWGNASAVENTGSGVCDKLLAYGTLSGNIKMVDPRIFLANDDGMQFFTSQANAMVTNLAFNTHIPFLFASGDDEGKLKVWDMRFNSAPVWTRNTSSYITSTSWSPAHADFITTGHANGDLGVWNLRNMNHKPVYKLHTTDDYVVTAQYLPNNVSKIFTVSSCNEIALLDISPQFLDTHYIANNVESSCDVDVLRTIATATLNLQQNTEEISVLNTAQSLFDRSLAETKLALFPYIWAKTDDAKSNQNTVLTKNSALQGIVKRYKHMYGILKLRSQGGKEMKPFNANDQDSHQPYKNFSRIVEHNLAHKCKRERLLWRLLYLRDYKAFVDYLSSYAGKLIEEKRLLRLVALLNRATPCKLSDTFIGSIPYWDTEHVQVLPGSGIRVINVVNAAYDGSDDSASMPSVNSEMITYSDINHNLKRYNESTDLAHSQRESNFIWTLDNYVHLMPSSSPSITKAVEDQQVHIELLGLRLEVIMLSQSSAWLRLIDKISLALSILNKMVNKNDSKDTVGKGNANNNAVWEYSDGDDDYAPYVRQQASKNTNNTTDYLLHAQNALSALGIDTLTRGILTILPYDHIVAVQMTIELAGLLRSLGNFTEISTLALALLSPTVYYVNRKEFEFGCTREFAGQNKGLEESRLESDDDDDDDDKHDKSHLMTTKQADKGRIEMLSTDMLQTMDTTVNINNPATALASNNAANNPTSLSFLPTMGELYTGPIGKDSDLFHFDSTNELNTISMLLHTDKHAQEAKLKDQRMKISSKVRARVNVAFDRDFRSPRTVLSALIMLLSTFMLIREDADVMAGDLETQLAFLQTTEETCHVNVQTLLHSILDWDRVPLWNPYREVLLPKDDEAPTVLFGLLHPRKVLTASVPKLSKKSAIELQNLVEKDLSGEILPAMLYRLYVQVLTNRHEYDRALWVTSVVQSKFEGLPFARAMRRYEDTTICADLMNHVNDALMDAKAEGLIRALTQLTNIICKIQTLPSRIVQAGPALYTRVSQELIDKLDPKNGERKDKKITDPIIAKLKSFVEETQRTLTASPPQEPFLTIVQNSTKKLEAVVNKLK